MTLVFQSVEPSGMQYFSFGELTFEGLEDTHILYSTQRGEGLTRVREMRPESRESRAVEYTDF